MNLSKYKTIYKLKIFKNIKLQKKITIGTIVYNKQKLKIFQIINSNMNASKKIIKKKKILLIEIITYLKIKNYLIKIFMIIKKIVIILREVKIFLITENKMILI